MRCPSRVFMRWVSKAVGLLRWVRLRKVWPPAVQSSYTMSSQSQVHALTRPRVALSASSHVSGVQLSSGGGTWRAGHEVM